MMTSLARVRRKPDYEAQQRSPAVASSRTVDLEWYA